jgi:uncharacterized protein YndB with AHSA1/START domain
MSEDLRVAGQDAGPVDDVTDTAAERDAIEIEVVYPHPVERVWRAITDSASLGRWLMPNDFEPRVGHHFTFRTEPDQQWSGVVDCEVVAVEPPRRVAYTWQGGNLPRTLVTFTLEPAGEGTRLRLVHSGFAAGGKPALTVRDILASGWNSKVLREKLPALLAALAADEV